LSEKGTSLRVSACPIPTVVPVPVAAGVLAAGVAGGVAVVSPPPPPPHPTERVKIKPRNSPILAGKLLTPCTAITISPAASRLPARAVLELEANLARAQKERNAPSRTGWANICKPHA
jgi:hypothetical protein